MIKDKKKKLIKYTRDLEKSQYLPSDELQRLRWERLKIILDYSYNHIPFYKRRFRESNITPVDIKSKNDLLKLPILTKADIQNHMDALVSDQYSKEVLYKDKTGGSTGSPLVFYYTADRFDLRDAATIRHDSWANLFIGDKVALLWGAAVDLTPYQGVKAKLRNFLLEKKLILDASSLTEEKMFNFVQALYKFKPRVILAYANTMRLFAEFVQRNEIKVPQPESIICSAEVLLPETRDLIENVFHTKVFNRYGCREFSVIASDCEIHQGMHINAENLYLEFVKDGQHVKPGELGEIIITDMVNYGMPLIRYNIKDLGTHLTGSCPCGRTLPRMEIAQGRVTDFLVTPQGKMVSGIAVCTYVITNIPGIKQIQIIQDTYDHILIKFAKDDQFTNMTINSLNQNIDHLLDPNVRRDFEYVNEIPHESSGKYRFCISEIKPS